MDHSSHQSFTEFDTVFCDSREILLQAYELGLPQKARVLTSSPAILLDDGILAQNVENRWTKKAIKALHKETEQYTTDLYNTVSSLKGFQDYAITLARYAINFQRIVYKAGCLESDDFKKPRLFLAVKTNKQLLNPPWEQMLQENPCFKTYYFQEKKQQTQNTQNTAGLFDRLKLGGLESIVYRLALKIWSRIPDNLVRNQLLVAKENHLIIEGGAHLVKKGIAIRQLPNPKHIDICCEKKHDFKPLHQVLMSILIERFQKWLVPEAVLPCVNEFIKKAELLINEQDIARCHWDKTLNSWTNGKKNIVISNSPHQAVHIALTQECQQRGIPFFGVQHGISHEIAEDYHFQKAIYETNVSDLFLTYNDKMSQLAETNMTGRGKSIAVGLSKRHLAKSTRIKSSKFDCPIVYISTNLYFGNMGAVINYINDEEKALQEIIDLKMLNELPYKVLYKTYPTFNRRYSDPDPVFDVARNLSNIVVFDEQTDMRYLFEHFNVIITTQATSTLTWALLSGKPVVFIDNPYLAPLRKEIKSEMSNALFLFERQDKDLHPKLKQFFSQPIENIEAFWKSEEKEQSRKRIIRSYFSKFDDKRAGLRIASIVQEYFKVFPQKN